MLPGMTGEEILAEITSKGSIPVIIISAKSEQQTKVKGLRSGADDFISKPFDVEEVSARIDSLLRRHKQTNETPKRNQLAHKDIQLNLEAKTEIGRASCREREKIRVEEGCLKEKDRERIE